MELPKINLVYEPSVFSNASRLNDYYPKPVGYPDSPSAAAGLAAALLE